MIERLLLLAPAIFAGAGCASSAITPASTMQSSKPDPLEYRSPFADYRPFADEPIVPWRDANETVKEAAGREHQGHR